MNRVATWKVLTIGASMTGLGFLGAATVNAQPLSPASDAGSTAGAGYSNSGGAPTADPNGRRWAAKANPSVAESRCCRIPFAQNDGSTQLQTESHKHTPGTGNVL